MAQRSSFISPLMTSLIFPSFILIFIDSQLHSTQASHNDVSSVAGRVAAASLAFSSKNSQPPPPSSGPPPIAEKPTNSQYLHSVKVRLIVLFLYFNLFYFSPPLSNENSSYPPEIRRCRHHLRQKLFRVPAKLKQTSIAAASYLPTCICGEGE